MFELGFIDRTSIRMGAIKKRARTHGENDHLARIYFVWKFMLPQSILCVINKMKVTMHLPIDSVAAISRVNTDSSRVCVWVPLVEIGTVCFGTVNHYTHCPVSRSPNPYYITMHQHHTLTHTLRWYTGGSSTPITTPNTTKKCTAFQAIYFRIEWRKS